MSKVHGQWISLAILAGLIVAWQIASLLITAESVPGEPMVPGWQVLATRTLLSLADNWGGGFGVLGIAQGGSRTYAGAVLAILSNSWDTSLRLYSGLLLGALVGVCAGLAVSWSTWSRRLVALPGQVMRTFPLLALIPLFQLRFGLTRTLGASRLRMYRTVILPAMFPELRSSILLSIGVAWTPVVGAEFLGAQTGLEQIIVYAKYFGYVDRMFLVGLILLVYTALTFTIFERASRPLIAWMPGSHADKPAEEVAPKAVAVREPVRVNAVLVADLER